MMVSLSALALANAETYFPDGVASGHGFDVLSAGEQQAYSSEFAVQLGFAKAWPLFVELWLELSFWQALKLTLKDLVNLKQFFNVFTERTRDYNYDRALQYGGAQYIATGRSFAALTSNFTHLFHLYARTHFYFAAKASALGVLYCLVTRYAGAPSRPRARAFPLSAVCAPSRRYNTVESQEIQNFGTGWLLFARLAMTTWPLWLISLSILLGPWVFNPQSFKTSALNAHFVEWLMWLDGEPGVANGMGSWHRWHTHVQAQGRGECCCDSACAGLPQP